MPFRRRREGRSSSAAAPSAVSFDTLESRQLLSATIKTVSAVPTVLKPVINTLKATSSALKKIALATDFTALTAFKKPTVADSDATVELTRYAPFSLQLPAIQKKLLAAPLVGTSTTGLVIALPAPDGSLERFRIFQSTEMESALAKQTASYIRTFTGIGIDDPTQNIAMDYTTFGLHASVLGPAGSWYIDPYWTRDTAQYASYFKSDLQSVNSDWKCDTDDIDDDVNAITSNSKMSASAIVNPLVTSGTQLRTYRLAMATTAEYTAYQGGTVAAALSAVTSVVTRLNQVYERDLGIHLNLIANESSIIYTSANDPFGTPDDADTTITELQSALDSVVGTANYDLGHVLHKCAVGDDNGLAGDIGSVGTAGTKGQGYSAVSAPTTDPFAIDYVAHEIGHQFGGHHNFSSVKGVAYDDVQYVTEPGSGTTIMGYAGIGNASDIVQLHSDAMFSSINYEQIQTYITGAAHGAVITSTGDHAPSVTAANGTLSYSIPTGTPFALTAVGTDSDASDVLTYSWEQRDAAEGVKATPPATLTAGPSFRNYLPTASPTRVFPALVTILAGGTSNVGETLPSVARSMHFTAMVRDNHAGSVAGSGASELASNVTVTTVSTGSAFKVLNLDTSTTLTGGATQLISWNVAGTTAAAFNATNVNILLSTDGGLTFPITLAAATANDGSQSVQLPFGVGSTTARIKIQPTGNIFFDINNANLTLTNVAAPNPSATPAVPILNSGSSDTGIDDSDGITRLNNSNASNAFSFSVNGTVSGALVELLADGGVIGSQTATGTTTVVVTNPNPAGSRTLADGQHSFTVRQTEPGKTMSAVSGARVVTIDATAPTLAAAPSGGRFGFETKQTLTYVFSGAAQETILPGDLVVTAGNGTHVTPSAVAYNAATGVATFSFDAILPDGNYTVKLPLDVVTDVAGNSVAADTSTFFVLAGDLNRDRVVNFDDLIVLAQNYNAIGKTFSQGNLDYSANGSVNFDDLVLLAQHYNVTLAPPAGLQAAVDIGSSLLGSAKDDELTPSQIVLA